MLSAPTSYTSLHSIIFCRLPHPVGFTVMGSSHSKIDGFYSHLCLFGRMGGLQDNTEKEWIYREIGQTQHPPACNPEMTWTNNDEHPSQANCMGGSVPPGLKNYIPFCVRFSHNEFAAALDDMGLAAGRRLPVAWPNLLPGSLRFMKLKVLGPTSH